MVATTTGTTPITLPSNFNELLITTRAMSDWVCTSLHVAEIMLSESDNRYISGGSFNGNDVFVRIVANKTQVFLEVCINNSSTITDNSSITVYYR